ncbi:MAG: hypothetical protein KF852_04250 [Saprospiraceae bacterium]|nr:hypothetical protein [Saprospiraceae bacterium]
MKHPRFNKAGLAQALGLVSPGGTVYYERLRSEVFTDTFMQQVGLDADAYQKGRIWPIQVRMKIMEALELKMEDFKPEIK